MASRRDLPRSVGRHDWLVDNVAFTPDGSTLVSVAGNTVSTRSVLPGEPGDERILLHTSLNYAGLAVDPAGRRVAVSSWGRVLVLPLAGGAARELMGLSNAPPTGTVAFSPDGRRLAAAGVQGALGDTVVRIWDLASGGSRVLGPLPGSGSVGDAAFATDLVFAADDHLVAGSLTSGLLLFDLHDGTHTVLSSRPTLALAVDRGRRVVLALAGESEPKKLVRLGLDDQAPATVFPCPGCHSVALDPTGMVVAAGSADGIVRIGPASGGEPHLFFGHPSAGLQKVAFSPDGRWVASSGEQPGVRLWPVPDVTRTPLHRRSHDEFLAPLHSWTNLRAVKDPQPPTGWKLEPGPFPGWAKLPRW